MTQEQFQDVLGMIDDDLIESVDKLRQQRDAHATDEDTLLQPKPISKNTAASFLQNHRRFLRWGSLAACVCVLVGVSWIWAMSQRSGTSDSAINENTFYSNEEVKQEAVKQEGVIADEEFSLAPVESLNSAGTLPETASDRSIPPALYVVTDKDSIRASCGNYDWCYDTGNGTKESVTACGAHPLDLEDTIARLTTTLPSVQLQFMSAPCDPYQITIHCWSEDCWGDLEAASEALTLTDGQLLLKEGGYIYQVTAKWSSGSASYCFYIQYTSVAP